MNDEMILRLYVLAIAYRKEEIKAINTSKSVSKYFQGLAEGTEEALMKLNLWEKAIKLYEEKRSVKNA
jgi:hypothetical protein